MPNQKLDKVLFPPLFMLVIRVVIRNVHDAIYYLEKNILAETLVLEGYSTSVMTMFFNSINFLAVLSLLYLLENLFDKKKYINKLSNAIRWISIFFYFAAGYVVMSVQNVEIISFVWVIVAIIPFILMVRMVNYSFQNSVTLQKDTEENAALN